MNFEEVKSLLKQRYPMIMVDRVVEIEHGVGIKAIKNITGNEIFFLGHFPEYSILPGVLVIEALAQSASILFSASTGKGMTDSELMVLGSVNDMRFLAPVTPGDRMLMEVKVIKMFDEAAIVEGSVIVDNNVVAKGKLTFAKKNI